MRPPGDNETPVTIVGGGLSGTEAALRLAEWGHPVTLHEMRPQCSSGAHKTSFLSELVCSNSLKSLNSQTPHGLLKEELLKTGSPVIESAMEARIPGGGALVVDRDVFARRLTDRVLSHPRIRVERGVVDRLPSRRPLVVATGPLTHPDLVKDLTAHLPGGRLSFYDAIAPIVEADSLDFDLLFRGDRHGEPGRGDHWNAPMSPETYERFCEALLWGERVPPHEGVEDNPEVLRAFQACQPVESLVETGWRTLAFGPLRPVGLVDPATGREPFAVVQLRPEDAGETAFNLVGFQTRLRYPEQERIFRMIPGLGRARFLRHGSLHRNTFLDAPVLLKPDLTLAGLPGVYATGQILGVEGYTESVAMGFLTALVLHAAWSSDNPWNLDAARVLPPAESALGALLSGLRPRRSSSFAPVNLHFGLFPGPSGPSARRLQREQIVARARRAFSGWWTARNAQGSRRSGVGG
ncbi:MAG: methylenetetrahydrofolate--tRNA-(uracil(54)-C(5))-methyltransferase (FADH(2)-oxidizing) TrmFO [Nitrospirae bacterium]|jgi:methylenetetrahydrofolate--tRNA-(uracil-5-)-methyltransferase|nr:methylenetetrahydrofolate--tRNA-(uracil(54)-C(5))-methyltransferase (FADH(2)-oxidizing) TrmFO [Nitrospirota bacterium]